jgi:hypothetical protein
MVTADRIIILFWLGKVKAMFGFWRRRKIYQEDVRREADALIDEYGEAAYEFARSRRIATLQQKNLVEHRFWCAVACIIGRHTAREVGVDTATHYVSASCERDFLRKIGENGGQKSVEAPPTQDILAGGSGA